VESSSSSKSSSANVSSKPGHDGEKKGAIVVDGLTSSGKRVVLVDKDTKAAKGKGFKTPGKGSARESDLDKLHAVQQKRGFPPPYFEKLS
jgi:hypothetical protein